MVMDADSVNAASLKSSKESGLTMVVSHLRNSSFGLSISDIAKKTGLNRNTISRYLSILASRGQVEIRTVGPSHVYRLSERLPISLQFLALQPEPTLVVDTDGIILAVNTHMQKKIQSRLGSDTRSVVGMSYTDLHIGLCSKITALPEYRDALNGVMPSVGTWTYLKTDQVCYRLWIMPVISFDGTPGIMIRMEKWPYPVDRE